MSLLNTAVNLLMAPPPGAAGYSISRSLRFNSSDSAYLSRTPASAGNRKTWTWAGWVKRSAFGNYQYLFCAGASESTDQSAIRFNNDETIDFFYFTGSFQWRLNTTQVFRDPSSWYHIVAVCDTDNATANNRARLYVNGSEVTVFTARTNPASGSTSVLNNNVEHRIGVPSFSTSTYQFSGYLADVHFIDGQALTPTSFTEVSATTGQLIPKAYTGSYGTNGFRLPFSDNSGTTSTTLGKDSAGSNNWTPNNFSVAAGAGNDSLVDTPTSYGTDTGAGGEVRGNYCTLNPLDNTTTLTDGNLNTNNSASSDKACRGTIAITSGKWYWEVTNVTAGAAGANASQIGISTSSGSLNSYVGSHAGGYAIDTQNGNKFNNASGSSYLSGASSANSVHGVAFDADNGTLTIYRNGSTPGTAFSSIPAGTYFPAISNYASNCVVNFGQRAWAYTPPANYRPLVDTLLPSPVVAKPNTVMDVLLWSGTGGNRSFSSLNMSPDFVWIKQRNQAFSTGHQLYDIVRGAGSEKELNSAGTAAEGAGNIDQYGWLSSFDSNGFSVTAGPLGADYVNASGTTYVAWTWDAGTSTVTNTQGSITSSVRANPSAGFSIVTYTGNSNSSKTIGHGLNAVPSLMIVKCRTAADGWVVYHKDLGNTSTLQLQSTNAIQTSDTTAFASTTPTSTVFTVGNSGRTGDAGRDYVAYLFSPVAGYSSFGSYTGNGSADGPFVYTGFRPRWIMFKRTQNADGWLILDAARNSYNVADLRIEANSSGAETDSSVINVRTDFLSNGFRLRGNWGGYNQNGEVFIYAAFAESPLQYSRAR